MRNAYLETLYELAGKDKNVFAIISDNGAIVYDKYRQDFPQQYINAGISEANMVGMAAGMANRGKVPFVYTIGAFLAYRAYEFILNDVCLQNQNVKMVGIGAGCSYSLLGPSHHTIFDLAVLRPLPNLTIFSPASPLEVRKVVKASYNIHGPVYIRLGTNRETEIYEQDYCFEVGKGVQLQDGTDLTLVGTGSIMADVLQAAKAIKADGVSVRVINIHTIKPFDRDVVIKAAKETGEIIVVEEHSLCGGLGSAISEVIAEENLNVTFSRMGFKDFVHGYGKHSELKAINGLAVKDICLRHKLI
jgi:transketolase